MRETSTFASNSCCILHREKKMISHRCGTFFFLGRKYVYVSHYPHFCYRLSGQVFPVSAVFRSAKKRRTSLIPGNGIRSALMKKCNHIEPTIFWQFLRILPLELVYIYFTTHEQIVGSQPLSTNNYVEWRRTFCPKNTVYLQLNSLLWNNTMAVANWLVVWWATRPWIYMESVIIELDLISLCISLRSHPSVRESKHTTTQAEIYYMYPQILLVDIKYIQ